MCVLTGPNIGFTYNKQTFNPRAAGGGHKVAPPFGFSAIAQQRVAIATQNFA